MGHLTVRARKQLTAKHLIFGGIWIGPGGGPNGDGDRGDLGQENANATIRRALEAGIVGIDTAPWYGSGACEQRLGLALRSLPTHLFEQVRVTTKVGRLFFEPVGSGANQQDDRDGVTMRLQDYGVAALSDIEDPNGFPVPERVCINDYTSEGASISLKHSLRRMGLDCVHALRVHDPNDNSLNCVGSPNFLDEVAIALQHPHSALAALRSMRDDKKIIREVSVGMNCNLEAHMGAPGEALRMLSSAPEGTFNTALLAGGWNLLNQDGIKCYEECERQGISVHNAGVFASGLLVDPAKEGQLYAYRKAKPEAIERAARWQELAGRHGVSLPAVAIAFATLPVCVSHICVGMATTGEVEQMLRWVEEAGNVPSCIWYEAKVNNMLHKCIHIPT